MTIELALKKNNDDAALIVRRNGADIVTIHRLRDVEATLDELAAEFGTLITNLADMKKLVTAIETGAAHPVEVPRRGLTKCPGSDSPAPTASGTEFDRFYTDLANARANLDLESMLKSMPADERAQVARALDRVESMLPTKVTFELPSGVLTCPNNESLWGPFPFVTPTTKLVKKCINALAYKASAVPMTTRDVYKYLDGSHEMSNDQESRLSQALAKRAKFLRKEFGIETFAVRHDLTRLTFDRHEMPVETAARPAPAAPAAPATAPMLMPSEAWCGPAGKEGNAVPTTALIDRCVSVLLQHKFAAFTTKRLYDHAVTGKMATPHQQMWLARMLTKRLKNNTLGISVEMNQTKTDRSHHSYVVFRYVPKNETVRGA